MISNLISLRTRIATPPPYLLGLSLRVMVSSLKLLLSRVALILRMSMSFSLRKRDNSTYLFLQLRIFMFANLILEELKEELNEVIFLNGRDVHGLFQCSWSMVLKSSLLTSHSTVNDFC